MTHTAYFCSIQHSVPWLTSNSFPGGTEPQSTPVALGRTMLFSARRQREREGGEIKKGEERERQKDRETERQNERTKDRKRIIEGRRQRKEGSLHRTQRPEGLLGR